MGLFGKSDDVLEEYQRAGSELGVFTLTLLGVEDPFDPDPLWDRKYGGAAEIFEQLSEDREFRLQAALDGCRNSTFVRDEAGRFREHNPVFTDVVMWIPEADWKADSMRGGHRIEALARNLGLLHRQKFTRSLPEDRSPIYTIMPDEKLDDDMVVFQFGFGVFVPGGDDVLRATVTLRRKDEDEPKEFAYWSFWREGAQIKRPVGVYAGQDQVLITPDDTGPIRAPLWFQHHEGHILVNLNAADSERIYADDDHIELVETNGGGKNESVEWVLENRAAGAKDGDRIYVLVTPLAKPMKLRETDAEQAVPVGARTVKVDKPRRKAPKKKDHDGPRFSVPKLKARTPAEQAAEEAPLEEARDPGRRSGKGAEKADKDVGDPGGFGLDKLLGGLSGKKGDAQTPISSRYGLKLIGIALMRIDGKRQLDSLLDWVVWFDDDGRPVELENAGDTDLEQCLALSANADDDRLYYRLAGESEFKPIAQIPCVLPTRSGRMLELAKSPVADRYHGILQLPNPVTFPLSPKALIMGRSNPSQSASQPDLPLELLDHPDSLNWEQGAGHPGAKLNAINLSRRHVTLQLKENRLDAAMAEGSSPVFILDKEGDFEQRLDPSSTHHVMLEVGQMIVIGSYCMLFYREQTKTMSSSEATQMIRRKKD